MMEEIWKDIKGFEGRYQVSNMGRVRYPDAWITRSYTNGNTARIRTRKASVKKNILNRYGYSVAMTQKGCKDRQTIPVCELVASHFGEGYEDGMQITHIDGDIANNRIDNLSFKWMEYMPGEQWKPIKNFVGLYEISNMGRVRSLLKYKNTTVKNGTPTIVPVRPKLLNLNKTKSGYYHAILNKDSKRYEYTVHRLVAVHFCEGYKRGYVVNHKDEDKTNNRADNLEWCTQDYNTHYGTGIERAARKQWKPVAQYDSNGNLLAKYSSCKEASEKTGFPLPCISDWCRGAHSCKAGYIWKFL